MFIFILYSNISNSYSLVRRISISHHNGWYRLRLHVFYSRHGHAKNPDKNFSLGFRPKQSLQACLGEKLQGRKKGIPFYTFRINKHFSVWSSVGNRRDISEARDSANTSKKGLPTIVVAWHTDESILMDDIWASGSELHVVQATESRLWWTCPSVFLLFVNAISRFSLSLAFVIQR